MPAHAIGKAPRRHGAVLTLPFALLVAAVAAATTVVSYLLWPTWPAEPLIADEPALPITVGGVLFEIPPAAIRERVQRHAGAHDRIDLVFGWPALTPPSNDATRDTGPLTAETAVAAARPEKQRLFVTIAALGGELPPLERLRTIYPRYLATPASSGPNGLSLLPFRAGSPYEGEDLIYIANSPEQFFARCTRAAGAVPGTCISERAIGNALIDIRFPRDWLSQWENVVAGFDSLAAQLRPEKK
jgi:hypothetical protein